MYSQAHGEHTLGVVSSRVSDSPSSSAPTYYTHDNTHNVNRRPSGSAISDQSSPPSSPKKDNGNKQRPIDLEAQNDSPATAYDGDDDDAGPADEKKRAHSFFGVFQRRNKKEAVAKVRPDPSAAEMAPFDAKLTPSSLYELVDPKSYDHLNKLGGTDGLIKGLHADPKRGLSDKDSISFDDRLRVYGANRTPLRKPKSLLQLIWMAYQDKVLWILSIAAIVSLALGLYQDLGTPPSTFPSTNCPNSTPIPNVCTEPQVDWVEGVAITIAIFIVVMVGAVNDWSKEQQFAKLNAQKEDRNVKALRDGTERLMSVYDVVVGDVLFVEPGEILPCDGVFLAGHNVRCDESGATGESDAVRKAPFSELNGTERGKVDCFLLSGSKVLEGVGSYVVTGVGESSFHGRILMSLQGETEETPLQLKLNALAELIAKLGSLAGLILFGALMIRFFVQLGTNPDRPANDKAQQFIQILIISVTIVVVAVPEGLPLAVTLALAFATRRMTKMNLLVRVLGACETMANATVVCTDKTGTLTTNKMSVVAGSIGVHLKFAQRLAEHADRTNANQDADPEKAATEKDAGAELESVPVRKGRLDFSTDMADINQHISPALQQLLNESVAINSTAFEGEDEHGEKGGFVGSKTETALLAFAKNLGWAGYKQTREAAQIVQMIPFSSERKAMGVVYKNANGKGYRLLLKGASEVLAKLCSNHVVVNENGSSSNEPVQTADFDDETSTNISRTIIFYANQSLRTIALCSRELPQWPPAGAKTNEAGEVDFEDLAHNLTLVGITAIEDPLREGVATAVSTCQGAGVRVIMVTGDNVLTARSIAQQCGIYSSGGLIMEGPVFRKLAVAQRHEVVPRLQVLARSSPEDKKILVEHLKSMGEVVGVTGDGTNDGPALKAANVGFSMGIAGTEVAKEASDIILMTDDFASIVSAIMWGRCVNDSVKKFLQFQISVNITAVVITFVTAVASSDEESALTAVQLLWVNLIMDTFAALALATDPATPDSLKRKPDRRTAPLITIEMWMHIIGQAIFQIIVVLVLNFAGKHILHFGGSDDEGVRIDQENELVTIVFNTFVWCQIFNQFNARRLDRGFNIFTGIFKNMYFIVIFCIMAGGQAIIVNFGGSAFQVVRIGGRDWAICIIIGLVSLPVGALIRCIPPGPVERLAIKLRLFRDPNAPLPTVAPEAEAVTWNEGIQRSIDNLKIFGELRGGRVRASSIVRKSRSKRLEEAGVQPSALMAMLPAMVISAPGMGWRPQEGSLSNPAGSDPTQSSVQLFQHGLHSGGEGEAGEDVASLRTRPSGHRRQKSATSGHSRGSSLATIPQGQPSGQQTLAPPSPSH